MARTPADDGQTITVHVPFAITKRGGRKMVVTPDGAPWAPRPRVDNAMVKALARAFRWQRMLDDGVCGTIEELAQREKVNRGYMSRVLRLTLLAPDTVEAILDGRQSKRMRLEDLLGAVTEEWEAQRTHFGSRPLPTGPICVSSPRLSGAVGQPRHRRH